jgi:hypothetical protein
LVILFFSKISGTLPAKLPSSFFSQKRRVIKVRIGKPISVAEQNEYKTTELYSEFLRKRPTCWPILTIKFKLLTAHLKIPRSQRNRYSC